MNIAISIARNVAVARLSYDARPYPLALHHWTEAEFVAFLGKHHFPGNTYRDRLVTRRQAVLDAVSKGLYVPAEVLAEDPSLEPEGHAQRESQEALSRYLEARLLDEKAQSKALEVAIGYWTTTEAYFGIVKGVLHSALARECADRCKSVRLQEWELELSVDHGRRPDHGPFGTFGGRKRALVVRGVGTWASHRVDWDYVNEALAELLRSGDVTYDQVWSLTGTGWQPETRHIRLAA